MWGYSMQVTDAALDQIAKAMRERDVTIAYLQEQLATYERNDSYAESRGAHARQAPGTLDPPPPPPPPAAPPPPPPPPPPLPPPPPPPPALLARPAPPAPPSPPSAL